MTQINRLFLLLVIVGPLHMAEQLLTSIEEFYSIRRVLASYYVWFAPASADAATVILITVVWTACSLMLYGLLVGGTARRIVLIVFGLFGAQEAHHVVQALAKGGYDAGLITCIPYAVLGFLLVAAVWREFRSDTAVAPAARSFA